MATVIAVSAFAVEIVDRPAEDTVVQAGRRSFAVVNLSRILQPRYAGRLATDRELCEIAHGTDQA